MYKDKLQNCSCNQFHCIGTCNRVEGNSMTNYRGGNIGSGKRIRKITAAKFYVYWTVHHLTI